MLLTFLATPPEVHVTSVPSVCLLFNPSTGAPRGLPNSSPHMNKPSRLRPEDTFPTQVFLVPVALGQCEPDCTGKNKGDVVSDPLNCNNYYICLSDGVASDASVPCPAGEEFDTASGTLAAPCKTPGTTPCTATCTLPPPPDCHLTCDPSLVAEYIRDPLRCDTYYLCSYGAVVTQLTCKASTPYFDGKVCVADPGVCCANPCTPYCYSGVVQAPDPLDCTAYYICLAQGPADANYHYKCDANKHFDIPAGRCVEGAECDSLCSGDGNSGDLIVTSTDPGNTDDPTETPTDPGSTDAPGGCVDQFSCTASGAFPQCEVCDPGYFLCGGPGEEGELLTCLPGFVFNTNPDQPYCVDADSCPYTPAR